MKLSACLFTFLLMVQSAVYAENSTFYYNKGVESFKTGDLAEAKKNFKQAVEVNPSYTLGHYGLGRVYIMQQDKIPEAIKHFKLSVSLDSGFVRGWFKLGLAEFIAGRYVESLHSFKEAYDRDKTCVEALYNMGVIYDLLGDDYKAFSYYRLYYRKVQGKKDDFL
ncbi:MAG TPA: tetratricopeptide repeat protein [Spirochaetota bacterium]|nr:tetratricopeptide repeat protein [Spirochaetota bacterium]